MEVYIDFVLNSLLLEEMKTRRVLEEAIESLSKVFLAFFEEFLDEAELLVNRGKNLSREVIVFLCLAALVAEEALWVEFSALINQLLHFRTHHAHSTDHDLWHVDEVRVNPGPARAFSDYFLEPLQSIVVLHINY